MIRLDHTLNILYKFYLHLKMDFLPQRTFTNFNFKNRSPTNKLKLPRIDTAFISYYDYERIVGRR